MRRRSSNRSVRTLALCTLAGASVGAWAGPARAQATPGFALNRFEPSETGSEWFANDTLDLRGNFRPALGVVAGLALAAILSYVINVSFFGWTISWATPWRFLLSLPVMVIGAALLAGYWPARQAARLDIAEPLTYASLLAIPQERRQLRRQRLLPGNTNINRLQRLRQIARTTGILLHAVLKERLHFRPMLRIAKRAANFRQAGSKVSANLARQSCQQSVQIILHELERQIPGFAIRQRSEQQLIERFADVEIVAEQ